VTEGLKKQRQQQTEYHTPPLCFAQQKYRGECPQGEGVKTTEKLKKITQTEKTNDSN